MSQAKVDKYKNYKKNRRENIKKEKQKAMAGRIAAWAVVVLIIVGVAAAIGVSIYNSYQAKLAALPTYGSTSFMLSDYAGMQVTDEDEEEADPTGAESEGETAAESEAEETSEPTEETSEPTEETSEPAETETESE